MSIIEYTFDHFLLFIILIKFIFVIAAIGHIIFTFIPNSKFEEKYDPKLVYWGQRTEFIFILSMGILLIYHFKPGKLIPINKETSMLFFLFGWVTLITANWGLFFTEPSWYKNIVVALK